MKVVNMIVLPGQLFLLKYKMLDFVLHHVSYAFYLLHSR